MNTESNTAAELEIIEAGKAAEDGAGDAGEVENPEVSGGEQNLGGQDDLGADGDAGNSGDDVDPADGVGDGDGDGGDAGADGAANAGDDPAVIAQAKAMGWSAKEDFKGDPSRHIDAATFVNNAFEKMPLLQSNLKKVIGRNEQLEKSIQILMDKAKKDDADAYERTMNHLRRERAEALSIGDVDAIERVEAKTEQVKAEREKVENEYEAAQPAAEDATKAPDYVAWENQNQWYTTDPDLRVAADAIGAVIKGEQQNLAGTEFFNEVTKRVKAAYPQKFSNPKRQAKQAVESGQNLGGGKKNGYSSLPPDARAACDKFVKDGIMSKDEYVKEYYSM